MEEIKERFAAALESSDDDYIVEFTAGRKSAEQSEDRPEDTSTQGFKDGYESLSAEEQPEPHIPVSVGLHPLGGIAIQVNAVSGDTAQARITVEEAWNVIGHLNALTGMLIQAAYVQQVTEAQNAQKLYVPRGGNG